MQYFTGIACFHGGEKNVIESLVDGNIDVTLGGGELGRGFYLGKELKEAKAWAYHKYKDRAGILMLKIKDDDFLDFNPLPLNYYQALIKRFEIKRSGQARTYLFNENIVWSPIIGNIDAYWSDDTSNILISPSVPQENEQYKYESRRAQDFINSNLVRRDVWNDETGYVLMWECI